MRQFALLLTVIGLGACDSGSVPPPSEQQQLRAPSPAAEAQAVSLTGDGISAGPEAFLFAAGKNEVEGALEGVLGKPVGSGTNEECGAGSMDFTDFAGGLTVNFQQGSMVGWFWRLPQDGDASSKAEISVPGDVQLGTSAVDASGADGFDLIDESTLEGEFSLGNKLGGFIENDEVSTLYSGVQCFFR